MDKMISIIRQSQDDPISIRELAKKLSLKQKDVLQSCEDEDLNINIGIMVTGMGCGVAEHDNIGDYTIEDLSYDIHEDKI